MLFYALMKMLREKLQRFAERPWSIVVPGVVGALVRLALLPWLTFPLPTAQDEFSYLLGADTFSHGRLTNPTHPLWRFFETIHVISVPTYASKYPPAQAFVLAIGERVFGHPFFGNILDYVLLITALVWMLRAFVPPAVAFTAGCCAAIAFGPGHSWIESYWGGTIAGIGAALVLGSTARIRSENRFTHAWLLALGIILLWFTRPFEGIFFIAAAALLVVFDLARGRRYQGFGPFLLTLATGGALTLAFQGYYDWRVTRDPLLLPYLLHTRQYDYEPPLWIQKPYSPTFDAGPVVRNYHLKQELGRYQDERHAMIGWLTHEPGSGRAMKVEMKERLKTYECILIFAMLVGLTIPLFRDPVVRELWFISGISVVANVLETFTMDHYMAPLFVALIALSTVLVWKTWRASRRGAVLGAGFTAIIVVLAIGNNAFRARRAMTGAVSFRANRARLAQELAARDGQQVVFVRYSPEHDAKYPDEYVYNLATIDSQQVVWARDLGPAEDQRLIAYYPGRHFWLLQADTDRPEPVPYP
jgi:hypothetical protein